MVTTLMCSLCPPGMLRDVGWLPTYAALTSQKSEGLSYTAADALSLHVAHTQEERRGIHDLGGETLRKETT
jgi:hypothetical protein